MLLQSVEFAAEKFLLSSQVSKQMLWIYDVIPGRMFKFENNCCFNIELNFFPDLSEERK